MRCSLLLALPFTCLLTGSSAQVDHALNDVNPFIGTGGHGHTFPGACVPNGLVQLSPDTRPDGMMDWDGCGGYHYSDSVIHGFSHTHLSGTGVADLCDVLLMPMDHNPDPKEFEGGGKPWLSTISHTNEHANAGFYSVHLDGPDVDAELTATKRVGVHRYQWPKDKEQVLVLDLKHRDKLFAGSILQVNGNEITGERRSASWAKDQHLYFCIRTNKPMFPSVTPLPGDPPPSRTPGNKTTQVFILGKSDGTPLIVKVGISAVSVEGARKNLDAETPGWDFDAVRQQAEGAWNAKLGKIEVTGGNREQQRIFYSALYHCYVAPYIFNDVDGNYRGMDGEVHHADHNVYTVFSLWDTFRALHPLMTILEPDMTNDFIKTFLLHYQQGGKLPVWELWGNETNCMVGYHSVSVIADAYLKGIRGFDAELALKAMVASAMQDNPGLNAYRTKGYISSEDESESVSKTLEYAYDDWCIAQMAKAMGNDSIAAVFQARSRHWQNVFDPGTRFPRARRNGGFLEPFDPFEVNFNFTEANAWQYSLFVPHDMDRFAYWFGGTRLLEPPYLLDAKQGLTKRLNDLFTVSSATTGRDQSDITGLIGQYAHGNEPSHHVAYLYNYVDQPEKARSLVDRIMSEMYHDAPDGLSGNEDCGQMSAWYVMSALGLYPVVPGSDLYWTGTTPFDEVSVTLPAGGRYHALSRSVNNGLPTALGASAGLWPTVRHATMVGGLELSLADGPPVDTTRSAIFPKDGMGYRSPFISSASTTFTDSLLVYVHHFGGGTVDVIRDGHAMMYDDAKGPIELIIREPGDVLAETFGDTVTAHFTRIEGGRTIQLESTFANQYAAGGDQALIDGLRGGTDFRTGEWQGFREHDVLATVDLGQVKKLQRVGLSVLQDQNSWVWYPASVNFAWSTNGRTWSSLTVDNTIDRKADGGMIAEMWTDIIGKKARYVKVTARNAGPCPDWHPGKGGTTWIFADEILIEAE